MKKGVLLLGLALTAAVPSGEVQQKPPPQPPAQLDATRPPADNDRKLRPLSPEEIPPNLSFYAMDPLYTPGAPLGWSPTRIVERLNRGLVASALEDGRVYLSWRLLDTDPGEGAFNVYRASAGGAPARLTPQPIRRTTDFIDATAARDREQTWWVALVANGREQSASERVTLPAGAASLPYRALKLRDVRTVDRVGIGDLDGDGVYDFIVKHPVGQIDPGRRVPSTDTYKVDAYNGQSGAFMWRIDLGWNINHGIWFSPMVVRDLDGDGKAEVCLRTAPYAATREQILDPGRPFVLDGPEYLAVYDGATGKEIDKVDWIERGQVTDWADRSGNRSSRHMLGVAYLDGKTPSVLVVRGTYGLMKVDAWMLRNRKLEKVWRWTNERAPFMYHGQGQHSIKTGDIDGDGADEILNGSIAIDNDGHTLWGTGLGHGDRFYLGDIDPERPGLEIWYTIEDPHPRNGVSLWEALTGRLIFGVQEATLDNQVASGLAADIDPAHPGMEVWGDKFFFTAKGQPITGPVPPQDNVVWWDADPLREILSKGVISKWQGATLGAIQGAVQHVADIAGDWREEIVVVLDGELRIYSTSVPAVDRRVSLMQDRLYRNDVTHRSMGYPHVPMTSYYLGARSVAPSRGRSR
jgi:rhamnogalacturonan endolyase